MRVAMLVAVLGLTVPMLAVPTPLIAAEARVGDFSVAELMQATALDLIFDQFGAAIAASARVSDISTDEIFLSHWEAAAASSFNGAALRTKLASTLDGKFPMTSGPPWANSSAPISAVRYRRSSVPLPGSAPKSRQPRSPRAKPSPTKPARSAQPNSTT